MTSGAQLRARGQADVLAADTAAHRGYADEVASLYEGMDLTKFY